MAKILFFLLFAILQVYSSDIPEFPEIKYKILIFEKKAELQKFLREHSSSKQNQIKNRVITTLNRKSLRYFRLKEPIIVPDTYVADLRAYSVFPDFYPSAKDIPKIIVVSNVYQAYACYEYGKLVRFASAITGKRSTPTYPGRYALQWRELLRRSSFNENWIMPFTWNFHRLTGMALHQFDMPGYPASHMCIRQFREDAEWLYYWGEGPKKDEKGGIIPMSGTPLIVVDFFDFKRRTKKWLELKSNKEKIDYLPSNPMEVEEALIPIVHYPPELRPLLSRKERIRSETALDTLIARGILPKDIRLAPSNPLIKPKKDTSGGTNNTKTQMGSGSP
ncbi:MAG: L,D-transpeptidase [Ignavibacteria bacterium]|nr:L,D-transpeptidase [Ignavibacteria bacterium]